MTIKDRTIVLYRHSLLMILLGLSYAFGAPLCAQNYALSGIWKGGLAQDDKTWIFDIVLSLQQEQNQVWGTSKITAKDGSGAYVVYKMAGVINGDKIELNDQEVTDENNLAGRWYWCKKKYFGSIIIRHDSMVLQGDWKNEGKKMYHNKKLLENSRVYCYPGSFRISREHHISPVVMEPENNNTSLLDSGTNLKADTVFQNRKVAIQQVLEVHSDTLTLHFLDNGQIDNDTISVYFNKALLLNRQRLSNKDIIISVVLLPDLDNELIMYAENLGLIPPNTALLMFIDKGVTQRVFINSTTQQSGTIILRKKS